VNFDIFDYVIIFYVTIVALSRLLVFVCRKWPLPGTPKRTYEEGVTLVIWTFERKRQQQQTAVIAVARVCGRIRQSSSSYGDVRRISANKPAASTGKNIWSRSNSCRWVIWRHYRRGRWKKKRERKKSPRLREMMRLFHFCHISVPISVTSKVT